MKRLGACEEMDKKTNIHTRKMPDETGFTGHFLMYLQKLLFLEFQIIFS